MTGSAGSAASTIGHATALCDLRRFDEATVLLRQIIAAEPQNAKAYCQLARALLGLGGREAEALAAARAAIAIEPDNDWPYRLASLALSASGGHPEAAAMARTAVQLAPHNPYCHSILACVLAESGRHLDEAHDAATRALALDPHNTECHMALGAVALADSRYDDAAAAFHQVMALDPDNSAARNELARVQLRQRRFVAGQGLAEVAGGFADAVRTDPRSAVSRRNLDLVLHLFLARMAYVIFLIAWLGRAAEGSPGLKALPALLLVIPGTFAVRFVRKLTPQLRRYLLAVARQPAVAVAIALDGAAVGCLIVGAFASGSGPLLAAAVIALFARLIMYARGRKQLRGRPGRARKQLASGMLWILALILLFVGVVIAGHASSAGDPVEALTGIAVLLASMVCLFFVVRQRKRR